MQRHFDKKLDELKAMLIKMGSAVEQNFIDSLNAVIKKDAHLAKKVIALDSKINAYEIQIDNGVVDILAL